MAKGKGKLHELLAVEGDLEGVYKKILEESKHTFSGKPAHFVGFTKEYVPFDDKEETVSPEQQEMTTTVHDKLTYMANHIVRYLDAVLQKEATNQIAVADLIVEGQTLAEKLPATFLLGLENKLKYIRSVYAAVPTLPPGIKWDEDKQKGKGVYSSADPEEKFRTAKTFKHKVLVPAQFPKEGESGSSLPAQIERWEEQVNIGKYVTHRWSGMLTPLEKSVILERIDKLSRAVKKARQRANSTEIIKLNIGKLLFDYINGK